MVQFSRQPKALHPAKRIVLHMSTWGMVIFVLLLFKQQCRYDSMVNDLVATTVTPAVIVEEDLRPKEGDDNSNNKCSIYLAPSSVPDAQNRPAGFGIFTTRSLKKGSYVFPQGEGSSIVIPDVKVNQKDRQVMPVWAQTIFLYPCVGFNTESDDPWMEDTASSFESNMNLGALGNFHPYLMNSRFDDTDVYRDNMLNRYKDPGAGAFSYHMGKKWYVDRDVNPAEELFIDYGESWFLDYELGREGKRIPHKADYIDVASIIHNIVGGRSIRDNEVSPELIAAILHQFRNVSARATRLLPKHESELRDLISRAPTGSKDDYAMALAHRTVFNRTVEWVEENGRCLDNIVPGESTLPQAGRGAFAARHIPSGAVVAPVPTLVQIPDKTTLSVYRHKKYVTKTTERFISTGEPVTSQLILNYCFGHEKSSMVLCPATNANMINHCSSRMKPTGECNEKGPNAELRWDSDFDPETSMWLKKSIDEISRLIKNKRRGLSFQVVATRDIQKGDEIFIDYGPAWEAAWAEHVATWTPPKELGFVPVTDMNNNITSYLRTEAELVTNPYPSKVRLGCFVHGFYHPCEVLELGDVMEPAAVGEPQQRLPVYKVRVYEWKRRGTWEYSYKWYYPKVDSIETHLSIRHIRFFHGMYSSDQHLEGTFRKHISLPDDMWPEQWKNL